MGCPKALLSGYTVDGSFQQYAIAKAAHVARLDKDTPLDAVAPVLCAGITVYKGLRSLVPALARASPSSALVVALAPLLNSTRRPWDSGSLPLTLAMRRRRALSSSAHPHLSTLPLVRMLSRKSRRLHRMDYVRPRGTVVCIGLPAGAYLRAPVFESVIKMVTIKGSYVGNRRDTTEALGFFRRGLIKAPFKVVGLSELQKVYDLMHEGKIAGRYVLDTSK